jgi:phosphatidylglycerophosphate synthase
MSISVIQSDRWRSGLETEALGSCADMLEVQRAQRHPISRWYLCPLALCFADRLRRWPVLPWHLTLIGLVCGTVAAAGIAWQIFPLAIAAIFVLAGWFFDRADGILARGKKAANPGGAWLDANTDEIVDIALQLSVAAAAARSTESNWPWTFLVLFLLGKYLLMHGLDRDGDKDSFSPAHIETQQATWLRRLYHLPANADVRVHLLAAALLSGCLTAQLALLATYYNVRWAFRYIKGLKQIAEASS